MKRALLGLAALMTATASQASIQIGFNSPSGPVGHSTNTYSNGTYSVTAYGYSNFNFSTNSGTSNYLYDKNGTGDEKGVGLVSDPSHDNEIWYADNNFSTIPAVILDVSSLLSKVSAAQFMMGSTTDHEQWILLGLQGTTWTLLNPGGTSDMTWENLPGWGTYSRYAFVSGGTVIGDCRTAGNVLLNGLLLQPVPEPATWAMMLLGFGAIGLSVRRRAARERGAVSLA